MAAEGSSWSSSVSDPGADMSDAPPEVNPAGVQHAYRDGDTITLCGQPLARLRRFSSEPFTERGNSNPVCRACATLAR